MVKVKYELCPCGFRALASHGVTALRLIIFHVEVFFCFSVDAVVERYKHEHIVEGLSLKEPVSRVRKTMF